MAIGPGKYDYLATLVRDYAEADGVVVLVIDGSLGSGFSVQCIGGSMTAMLPKLLRHMADEIERGAG